MRYLKKRRAERIALTYSELTFRHLVLIMKLIRIHDLAAQDIQAIWQLATKPCPPLEGTVAWSFEGNGIRTRTTFVQAFRELNLSYLFITHNLAVVEYIAHEVCVMYLGRIVERGTTAEVMRTPKHPYTQALFRSIPLP